MSTAALRHTIDPVRALLAGFALLFPLFAYFGTAASIVAIWERSGTFAHGYVIVPLALWLVWRRRAELAALPLQPCLPALLALFACGAAWMVAELGEVQVLRQYAFVAMVPLTALTVLGLPMARAMAFPLAFLLFAVPFGEVFTEPLINITANFTVDALRLVGIPVFREGNNFMIPSGSWSVVEACSGVRYLISSVTLGCLYAYLTYRSTWRRALFIVLAIIVPIVANGLRAFMIVMMGHLSGMTMAVGFDHLVYGWLFFGIVMFLLFWIGSFWREDHGPDQDLPPAATVPAGPAASTPRLAAAVLAAVLVVGAWPAYLAWVDQSDGAPAAPRLAPLAAAPAAPFATAWTPGFPAPAAQLRQYVQQGATPVGLVLQYYQAAPGVKLISSMNRIIAAHDPLWSVVGSSERTVQAGTRTVALRETLLSGPGGRIAVWHWYWIGGDSTGNPVKGKLLQVRQRLLTGKGDGAAVFAYAPYEDHPDGARLALQDFIAQQLPAIDAALARQGK